MTTLKKFWFLKSELQSFALIFQTLKYCYFGLEMNTALNTHLNFSNPTAPFIYSFLHACSNSLSLACSKLSKALYWSFIPSTSSCKTSFLNVYFSSNSLKASFLCFSSFSSLLGVNLSSEFDRSHYSEF